MASWIKTLKAAQQTEAAIAFAKREDAAWTVFAQNVVAARMGRALTTRAPHFELHVRTETVARTDKHQNITKVRLLTERTYVNVTKTRIEKLGRTALSELNKYKRMLAGLRHTNELVVTKAQREYIEEQLRLVANGKDWKILCGLYREDTGATAIRIKEGDRHIVLFEDGSLTSSRVAPEFGGSWYLCKRTKRNNVPAPTKTRACVKVNGNKISIR